MPSPTYQCTKARLAYNYVSKTPGHEGAASVFTLATAKMAADKVKTGLMKPYWK